MKDINKSLKIWLEDIDKFELTKYESLPDIDLYMDQMLTYLERQLNTFAVSTLDKQITSSMINNYVKGDCIPSPISKKYNRIKRCPYLQQNKLSFFRLLQVLR